MNTDRNYLEIEVKIKLGKDELEKIRGLLPDLGFALSEKRAFEQNIVFDTADHRLKKNHQLLRLREVNGQYIMTFKRPTTMNPAQKDYKIREELEVTVSDLHLVKEIFLGLGYEVFFLYEKYRETFSMKRNESKVSVMLDHTPIGDFMEIEGNEAAIDEVASELGFSRKDYITANYYKLFRKQHELGNMQFSS